VLPRQADTGPLHLLCRQLKLIGWQLPRLAMKQLTAWSAKYPALAHPRATQSPTQVRLKAGGFAFRSMQPNAQVRISKQLMVVHCPQSCGQLTHVSYGISHWPSPHTAHGPQSCGQLAHVSFAVQVPSPQPGHLPQSAGQV
jgi:hypothetical protein